MVFEVRSYYLLINSCAWTDLPGEKQVYYPWYQVDFAGSLSSLIVTLCCIIQIYPELRNTKFDVWSLLCYLQFLLFTTWAPSITKQKDCGQNGLGNYYILRGSLLYLRNDILSHYNFLSYNYIKSLKAALTSASSRRLLQGMLKC